MAGFIYAVLKRQRPPSAMSLFWPVSISLSTPISAVAAPSLLTLFIVGLRAGLLTFGGAYTAIPIMQYDAVTAGGWMSNAQFLDGLALGGILPAPLIIFSTFVGHLGNGRLGALVITLGVFGPAFAFTLIGHEHIERFIENKTTHAFLDGITAGVVGLIAATALALARHRHLCFGAYNALSLEGQSRHCRGDAGRGRVGLIVVWPILNEENNP